MRLHCQKLFFNSHSRNWIAIWNYISVLKTWLIYYLPISRILSLTQWKISKIFSFIQWKIQGYSVSLSEKSKDTQFHWVKNPRILSFIEWKIQGYSVSYSEKSKDTQFHWVKNLWQREQLCSTSLKKSKNFLMLKQ